MKRSPDYLYELLPAVYRTRDAERGYPLQALLRVINEQVSVAEADIAQMYDNWFIETCEDWVVPYIGDLIGHKVLPGIGEPSNLKTAAERARERIVVPRRDVANVLHHRRRKGSLALLELLARDASGLPTRAVEFYKLLGWAQSINFPHLKRGHTVDLRKGRELDLLGSPFDKAAHSVDIRRAVSARSQGRFNVPGVGLFAWRMRSYSITDTPAYCTEEEASEYFTFSVLGNNTRLYNLPRPEADPTDIAGELNVPIAISRRSLEGPLVTDKKGYKHYEASEDHYGKGKSILISVLDEDGNATEVPRDRIVPANLSDWDAYRPRKSYVAVDPELGRIIFHESEKPENGIAVTYHYGFSADMGGGEYDRTLSQPRHAKIYPVGKGQIFPDINKAIQAWKDEKAKAEQDGDDKAQPPRAAVIEIRDNGEYSDVYNIELKAGEYLQIRAANHQRPVIRLVNRRADRSDAFSIKGEKGSRFVLDGLLITGRAVRVRDLVTKPKAPKDQMGHWSADMAAPGGNEDTGGLCDVVIRHCTLVPGRALEESCDPQSPDKPSLRLEKTRAKVVIEHSILGGIEVEAHERASEPSVIQISDSILDATGEKYFALCANADGIAYVNLHLTRSTVIGRVRTHAISLAENSIFKGLVNVARRQQGCFRFCYVPPGSRTPRRYLCQPETAEQKAIEELRKNKAPATVSKPEIEDLRMVEKARVRPRFDNLRYGNAAYCRLSRACAEEITRGADDEAEMGVFHDLYLPQRVANLQARLDEFTPSGADAAIIYAD
jgi:hypothetical protein